MIKSIRYIDFNNNSYSVKSNFFSYHPIQAAQSSSGIYSGGEPKKGVINPEDFEQLLDISEKIVQTKQLHLDKRRMMTALLFVKGEEQQHRLIIGRSELQRRLETMLKTIREAL